MINMWKCKECNHFSFKVKIEEHCLADFEKNGKIQNTYAGGEKFIEEVECIHCKRKGKNIQEIAYWEED